jgi:diketogulonate reductase-like aldo/keto reductase
VTACAANQVYLLAQRSAASSSTCCPGNSSLHQMPLMAYSPIDQGDLCRPPRTCGRWPSATGDARRRQIALAWVLSRPGVMAIPKAARRAHLEQNWAAASATLDSATLAALDALFPPPRRRQPLAMR